MAFEYHTGGNENLVNNGPTVITHENVRDRLSTGQLVDFLNKTSEACPLNALPTITYNDSIIFYFNAIKLMYTTQMHILMAIQLFILTKEM